MTVELSKYMTEFELDRCISFMDTLKDTKYDINPSVDDCKTQLEIILGKDRFKEIVIQWSKDNQKILTVFGTKKYQDKRTKELYDGLDDTDDPNDYEVIYV